MRFLKDWLSFWRGERRGIVVLAALLLALLVVPPIYRSCTQRAPNDSEIELFERYAATLTEAAPRYDNVQERSATQDRSSYAQNLFPFDPNTIPLDSLLLLGFSTKQASAIVAYRERGGRFRTAADFFKLNVITQRQKDALQSYVSIAAQPQRSDYPHRDTAPRFTPRTYAVVDLNVADTAQLRTLPGIGAYFAQKIVEQRDLLGGYVQAAQLLEIKNFGEERLQRIASRIVIDTALVRHFALDSASLLIMRRHPYIGAYAARGIVQMARRNARPATLDELVQNNIITPQQAEQLSYYVK
ncbi:MAG: helix-hairpin-helix domain-containing protein [Prevotellaceae bacterium]|jgi:DNA uptake protein ComE-like DNA-binding protein|nr:helix-hairpin-helix domain-containing protein [Prevotellaceae bacterium]